MAGLLLMDFWWLIATAKLNPPKTIAIGAGIEKGAEYQPGFVCRDISFLFRGLKRFHAIDTVT